MSASPRLRDHARTAAIVLAAACAPSAPRSAAAPAPRPDAPAASLTDRCPEQAARLARFDDAIAARPGDPALHYFRARSLAACGAVAETAAALHRVAELGDGFLPVSDLGFAAVWDEPAVNGEIEAMDAALPRVAADAPVLARAPDPRIVPEGIAYDPATRRIFLSSLTQGRVIAIGPDAAASPFAESPAPLTSTLGIAIDPLRRRMFVVATNAILGQVDAPTNAVLELDADTGELRRRLAADGAGQLNDVALAPDGTVYGSDSWLGGIWRAELSATALVRWPADVELYGANGLAADTDALYVAHATGIARIDRSTGDVLPRIDNDTRETLAAIDGLYLSGRALVGIQNVTNPGRVIAARLDPSGTRVIAVTTLLSHHHPALAEPTTGAMDGDRFLLLASTFVGRLRPDGTLRDEASVRPAEILELSLDTIR